jgi:hypothetical protein
MRPMPSAFLLAALLALPAAAQNTWYVDVHATPPGNGSLTSPYTSIQYAINQSSTQSGDTVLVAPGTYIENIADAPGEFLNIVATGGPSVTELRSATPSIAGVKLNLSRIEGFMVTGNASSGTNGGALNLAGGTAVRCVVPSTNGVEVVASNGELFECTILGSITVLNPGLTMRNTIVLWPITVAGSASLDASYSAGASMHSGTGNIIADPGLWWFIPGSNHLLAPGSPCIDAGDPSSPPDPDGSRADIGAIPFDPNFNPTNTWYVDVHATPPGNGSAASP